MKISTRQLEKKRFSLLTKDLTTCVECGRPKDDLHEVYEGTYRRKSMQYGCVIPLCRQCHNRIHLEKELKLKYKRMFEKLFKEYYPEEDFHAVFFYKDI